MVKKKPVFGAIPSLCMPKKSAEIGEKNPEMTHLHFGLAFLGKLTKLWRITGCINLYKSYLLHKYKS